MDVEKKGEKKNKIEEEAKQPMRYWEEIVIEMMYKYKRMSKMMTMKMRQNEKETKEEKSSDAHVKRIFEIV